MTSFRFALTQARLAAPGRLAGNHDDLRAAATTPSQPAFPAVRPTDQRVAGPARTAPVLLTLAIPRQASMIRHARHWFRAALAGWHPESAADAEAIFSEIATNAFRHGRGRIKITVRLSPTAVRCDVSDSSWRWPCRRFRHDPDLEDGRGIAIVTALAHAWGVRPRPRGKTVWFQVLAPHGRDPHPQ